MRKQISRSLFSTVFLILFQAFLFGSSTAFAEVVERILAVVNDEIVTEQDLEIVMGPVAAQYRTMYTGAELQDKLKKMRQEFLYKIIEDKMVLSEAKRKQVIVKDDEVDDMMADVRSKFPSRDIFVKSLADQGLTEKKLWNRFRDQIMTQKLVNFEVKSKISVSPGEVSEYYKAHPEEFAQGDRVKLLQILVRTTSRSEEEAKTFAEGLLEKIKNGESFEELAKNYSEGSEAKEGGQMGWIEKGQLLGEIDEKVFSAAPGEVTPLIKSSLGWHIFKVTERQKFSVKPLSEVRNYIADIIFKNKLRTALEAWLQNLKKNAYISIR
jgi:parvulin-like peptidyl-prolyl isomerase